MNLPSSMSAPAAQLMSSGPTGASLGQVERRGHQAVTGATAQLPTLVNQGTAGIDGALRSAQAGARTDLHGANQLAFAAAAEQMQRGMSPEQQVALKWKAEAAKQIGATEHMSRLGEMIARSQGLIP